MMTTISFSKTEPW